MNHRHSTTARNTAATDGRGERPLRTFRWLLVACQAATLAITWPLWQVRSSPPLLPMVDAVQFDVGVPLVASLAVVLWRPLPGVLLHSSLLIVAMIMDQMRLQPETASLAILLWGTLPSASAQMMARAHLVTMWFYAGFHKLVSSEFHHLDRLLYQAFPSLDDHPSIRAACVAFSWLAAVYEMALALLVLWRPARRFATVAAVALHVGILAMLAPLVNSSTVHPNYSIWPWNVALACAPLALVLPWKESVFGALGAGARPARVAAVALAIYPLGFYVGWVDAFFAHCLFAANTPIALLQTDGAAPRWVSDETFAALRVPVPPEHRTFEAYFRAVAKPGDEMTIADSRVWARGHGLDDRRLTVDGEYRQQKPYGPWVHRFPSGRAMSEGGYEEGQQHGPWTFWYENGNRRSTGNFTHGKRSGPWQQWYENGRIEAEGPFVDGEMEGSWTFWSEEGHPRTATFRAGRVASTP